jgi:hypothetical protein
MSHSLLTTYPQLVKRWKTLSLQDFFCSLPTGRAVDDFGKHKARDRRQRKFRKTKTIPRAASEHNGIASKWMLRFNGARFLLGVYR